MSNAKKVGQGFEDPINAKIQRKFDLVFIEKPIQERSASDENSSSVFNDSIDFDMGFDDSMAAERKSTSGSEKSEPTIDLDFSMDDETPPPVEKTPTQEKTSSMPADDSGFSLDFDFDSAPVETKPSAVDASDPQEESEGFTIGDISDSAINFDEVTKKTVVVSPENLTNSNLAEFRIESTGTSHSSADMMSTEEAKANIESTIKDILKPKLEATKETDISGLMPQGGISEVEDSVLDFGDKTPSKAFSLDELGDEAFSVDASKRSTSMTSDTTGDFDIGGFGDGDFADEKTIVQPMATMPEMPEVVKTKASPVATYAQEPVAAMPSGEDAVRVHATIRALREEREELLAQIKGLKSESKELEQDNLTLKANLDEAKIEITILRKRHMVELEDLKYRLTISEEKKAIADERARQADARREKLEQKVRIDFNQVKQREKELESKLELLSMDVDSQVQSRDQKILELRRKIDALEFNMENASIKEQKSLDDKRKLEDRLNKIMKTLRHSIKNLEDDIDHVEEDDDRQKEKN